ncbi:helix-turn-helix domain-containing protein [Mesorhizobium sp. M1396]|uniref:helix-turn-helix domain-containing protein n=1 Tax=Mesorhizobium sp. M1396 TaxID=2957095 RepID=UPI0033365C3B
MTGQTKSTAALLAILDAFAEVASAGLKELDRLVLVKGQMERRLRRRRKNSSLPALIELVLARPVVSAGCIAAELKISQRAALDLVAELGIREVTGGGATGRGGSCRIARTCSSANPNHAASCH